MQNKNRKRQKTTALILTVTLFLLTAIQPAYAETIEPEPYSDLDTLGGILVTVERTDKGGEKDTPTYEITKAKIVKEEDPQPFAEITVTKEDCIVQKEEKGEVGLLTPVGSWTDLGDAEPPETQQEKGSGEITDENQKKITWTYDRQTLTIESTETAAELPDYALVFKLDTGDSLSVPVTEARPWESFAEMITSVIVGSGIARIGDWALAKLNNLIRVEVTGDTVEIGDYAFAEDSKLAEVVFTSKTAGVSYENADLTVKEAGAQKEGSTAYFGSGSVTQKTSCINSNSSEIQEISLAFPTKYDCVHLNIITIPGYVPTETEPGMTDGFFCKDCYKWLVEQKKIAPNGKGESPNTYKVTEARKWQGSITTGGTDSSLSVIGIYDQEMASIRISSVDPKEENAKAGGTVEGSDKLVELNVNSAEMPVQKLTFSNAAMTSIDGMLGNGGQSGTLKCNLTNGSFIIDSDAVKSFAETGLDVSIGIEEMQTAEFASKYRPDESDELDEDGTIYRITTQVNTPKEIRYLSGPSGTETESAAGTIPIKGNVNVKLTEAAKEEKIEKVETFLTNKGNQIEAEKLTQVAVSWSGVR